MTMNDEAEMTEAGARLLNFLENHLRRQEYEQAEKLLRAMLSEAEDENGLPRPGGAMDQRHSFAMDSRNPGRVVADRDMAIMECESTVARSILLACDSAEAVFRTALRSMGSRSADSVHSSALPALFRETRRHQAGISHVPDARSSASFASRHPLAARVKSV